MTTQPQIADRPRLLFVDDEKRVLNSMRAMFRRDYELFLTTRGDEALKIISEQSIDVLVADQRMPIMTGVELLSAARLQSPGTVRILLTGYSDPEAIEGAIRDGKVFRLLNKPCPAEELRTIINEAVQIARENPDNAPQIVVDRNRPGSPVQTLDDDVTAPASAATVQAATDVRPAKAFEVGEFASAKVHDDNSDEPVYDVDEFADTTTMEIVMSGDTITVMESGDEAPKTYNAPAPRGYGITPEAPTEVAPSGDETEQVGAGADTAPDIELDMAPTPSFEVDEVGSLAKSPSAHVDAGRDSPTLLLYVMGAVLATLTVAWLLLNARDSSVPATVSAPAAPQSEAPTQTPDTPGSYALAENLEFGALALDAGALISPPGASALAFYLDARAQAPDNAEVARGLGELAEKIIVRARDQLSQQNYTGLLASLRALSAIDAVDPRLATLRADLNRAIDARFAQADGAIAAGDWDAATALIDELAALPFADPGRITSARASLDTAVQQAELRRAQRAAARAAAAERAEANRQAAAPAQETATGADLESTPVTVSEATAAEATTSDPAAERQFQIDQLLANATAGIEAGRLLQPPEDSARYYLEQVQRVEPDNPALVAGFRELAGALVQRALAEANDAQWEAAEATLAQAESLGVAGARVARTREQILAERFARESARVIPMREMTPVALVPARYPDHALREGTEGWALLNFTVLPDGSVADIEAVETSGRYGGRFARAARSAAAKWQFQPRVFLGQTIAQRVEARVKFELAD